ncbi:MAG: hypothetical protein FJ303_02980 [Planctomycetes bacterium]|nr:hypothetical protein [Planctomycetota bacterium]
MPIAAISPKIVEAMNLDPLFTLFLEIAGVNVPTMVMLVIAMVITYSNRFRHPDVARWAMFGFATHFGTACLRILLVTIGFPILGAWFPWILSYRLEILFGTSCLQAVGYIFLLIALNAARSPYHPSQFYDDFEEDKPPPAGSGDDRKPPPGSSDDAPRPPRSDSIRIP